MMYISNIFCHAFISVDDGNHFLGYMNSIQFNSLNESIFFLFLFYLYLYLFIFSFILYINKRILLYYTLTHKQNTKHNQID